MKNAQGSWSGMRKYLEKEMLADSLKGRVSYFCSTFVGMHGFGLFAIKVDGIAVKQFSMETVASGVYTGGKPVCMTTYWKGYWAEKGKTPLGSRREFDDEEFSDALRQYRGLRINDSLLSYNPIVRMFAILDRRAGKRTLEKISATVEAQPEWLQFFYKLRMDAEDIPCVVSIK